MRQSDQRVLGRPCAVRVGRGRPPCIWCLLLLLTVAAVAGWPCLARARSAPRACRIHAELRGVLTSATAGYLQDALRHAEESSCTALVVEIDTPGGSMPATREVVRAFLNAPVPVVAHVAPSGARAGSAGMFVTLAAHVAVMDRGTNIGASHPVTLTGRDPEAAGGEHMARKIENDAAAMARAIAEERDRNVEWTEKAVRESVSLTSTEALQRGVIDLVLPPEQELADALDGREVQLADGRRVVLSPPGEQVRWHDMTLQQQVLGILGQPNVVYALLLLGVLGIMFELNAPGLLVPGAIGALCLLLATIGASMLPVRVGALLLVLAGGVLLVLELYVTSYGILTAGGLALLALGASLLVGGPTEEFLADASLRVSWAVVLPMLVLLGGAAAGLAVHASRVHRQPVATGKEAMLGAPGVAVTDVDAAGGRVRAHGELWQAVSDEPVTAGQNVRIDDVRGLQLRVSPAARETASSSSEPPASPQASKGSRNA